ncbi:12471_t:CDS:10 [Cetraspora pellucida]|uniref:12471_t:CDS:1 n=1 Tax=Cetraspora pellucida TaxID=1433469 RepID=A0A9N9G289_9GLOM|nr:12471_t:CDS:10 [Cetraspora pellucida]
MSLYGDLPPPTHSTPSADKEETQQSALETQSTNSKSSKSALPVGWTPGTLRFMPTIQRKPVIQAKPKLIPKASVTSPNPPSVSTSSTQNNAPTSNLNSGKKQGKGVNKRQQAPLTLEDDYDPTRPNDYEEYKEYEKRRKEAVYHEEHSRRRSMSPEPRQRSPPLVETPVQEAPRPRTPPAKIDLDITGEEAFLRRARLSNRVSETTQKSPEPKVTSGPSSGEDFAHRILAKYGWQEGLGKDEQGINEPLKVQKTDYRSGIIVNTSTNIPEAKSTAKIDSASSNVEVPSRVGPGEVDDTLQEETADECNEKYGAVERCLIFEVPNGKLPDDQAVRIFVKFVAQAAAVKAKKDLNGRFFGGLIILVPTSVSQATICFSAIDNISIA